jgi:hypothetical protein
VIIAPTPELLREQMVTAMKGFPITELLPEQQRYVGLYREEYFRVGSSTEPADRPRAEAAITALYASFSKPPPYFEWGPSPQWGKERSIVLGPSISKSFSSFLCDAMYSTLDKSLSDQIIDDVEFSLSVVLRESFTESLVKSLGKSPRPSSIEADEGPLYKSIGGSHESYWIAYHLYNADVLNVPYIAVALQDLLLHDAVARSCGWWWPYRKVCFCTDRPEILEWTGDDPPKLRRVRYRDGFEVKP